jgi:tetratricopeptide (TPR) repeat protein
MPDEEDQCCFCHKLLVATTSEKWRASSGELIAVSKSDSAYIFAKTSRGEICICEECYKNGIFGDLNCDDIAEIHYQFGLEYRETGRASDSVDALHRGLQLKQTADMLVAIAISYNEMKESNLEHEFYRQALALDPSHLVARENLKNAAW